MAPHTRRRSRLKKTVRNPVAKKKPIFFIFPFPFPGWVYPPPTVLAAGRPIKSRNLTHLKGDNPGEQMLNPIFQKS